MVKRDQLKWLGVLSKRAKKSDRIMPFWIQLALSKLDRQLTLAEQKIVRAAAANPSQINWPDWWEAH